VTSVFACIIRGHHSDEVNQLLHLVVVEAKQIIKHGLDSIKDKQRGISQISKFLVGNSG